MTLTGSARCTYRQPRVPPPLEVQFKIFLLPPSPHSLQVAPIFLGVQPFPYNSAWFAGIYVRGRIPKSFLVRVIMKVVRNTVEGMRFISFITNRSVLVAVWTRISPIDKRNKERLRQVQVRREEE
ncbi:MAG: hypothetical protein WAZ77_19935 [Candidatus Nitrosopolaris sp.]